MNNSNKFAIIVDTNTNVPALVETIQELNLVERHQQQVNPKLLALKKLLVFDKKESYDYELQEENPLIVSWLGDIFGKKTYKVSSDLDNILDEIYSFAGKTNHKKKKKDMTIEITISRPVEKRKRKVRVFSNFVKVGWDQYSIKHDYYTGYEYVVIKGNRYEVVRDIFGQGVLVEI